MSRCGSVRDLLHRDTASLAESDRIVLEDHLETCITCQRARDQIARAREVAHGMPVAPIGPAGHQRAIAKAMLRGAEPEPRERRWIGFAIAGAATCAAILAVVIATRETAKPTPAPPPTPPVAMSVDAPPSLPPSLPAEGRLDVQDAQILELSTGTFALAAETELAWSGDSVTLERGTIDVDVDPKAGAQLRVVTEKFVVEVTGTAFQVTPKGVSVSRGSVRIVAPDGSVLVARLGAGESWSIEPIARPTPPTITAAAWLDRARRAFVAKDCKAAEQHADAALDAAPSRAQSAEARTLLAECAQAAGRIDEAIRRYDSIASRFADLPAGETALVAAARLDLGRGRSAEARARFERYVKRYPTGRFADDARRQLQTLP